MPTSTLTKFYSFALALTEKKHNLTSDVIKVALTAAANAPVVTNTILANLTEISYTNCSARTITVTSNTQTTGVEKWVLADLTLTASGGSVGPFRYAIIYNDTAASKELIGWLDYGADQTLGNGESLVLDFDATTGILTVT